MAGVLPAVLWRQVLQTQRPPLLLAAALVRQRAAVFEPDDVGPRVPAGGALQPHRAALRPSDDALPHLGRLGEARPHCRGTEETRGEKVSVDLEERTSVLKFKSPGIGPNNYLKLKKKRKIEIKSNADKK